MKCPHCNGLKTAVAHMNTGLDSGKHRWEEVACRTCEGSGEITDDHAERIAEGRRLYYARVSPWRNTKGSGGSAWCERRRTEQH